MAFLQYFSVVAAFCVVQFVPYASATDGGQRPLLRLDCLPGPLSLEAHPACMAAGAGDGDDTVSWHPWTSPPYCPENTVYCVFTNAGFQGPDRGVSLIDVQPSSTSNAASAVDSVAQLLSSLPIPETTGDESPPYEIRDIAGKGKGLVATRKILRGQAFMVDYAAVVADKEFSSRIKRAQGRRLLKEAIHRLPSAKQVLSLARSSSDPDNVPAFEDVMKTNSFNVEIAGKGYMALFPQIARINHACQPSALTHFNSTTLSNTLTAFHDILPDQEITLSYSAFGLPSKRRHALLQHNWGFTCTCPLCTSAPEVLAASDARREMIDKLGKKVVKLVEQGSSKSLRAAAELYEKVAAAVEEEKGLVPSMDGYWEVLGRLWVAAGEMAVGKGWLEKAKRESQEVGGGGVW